MEAVGMLQATCKSLRKVLSSLPTEGATDTCSALTAKAHKTRGAALQLSSRIDDLLQQVETVEGKPPTKTYCDQLLDEKKGVIADLQELTLMLKPFVIGKRN